MASPSSSSQTLVKRQSDSALMPPPPPPKRIKRPATVLDEDTYTDALSHIIARDFFPGLLETQTKQEYLDALESKDKEWIASAGRKLSEVMTPGRERGWRGVSMTPQATPAPAGRPGDTPTGWGGDTPVSVMSTSTSVTQTTKKSELDVSNLSLGAFQAKYTSEDNESFNQLLDKQNTKRREKYAWMWSGNKIPSARQIAHRQREEKRLIAQGQNPEGGKSKELALTTDMDARPAKPDAWKSRPENSLMFMPSSIEDTHETVQQRAEAASRAGPKQVVYSNTRLQPTANTTAEDSAIPPSPSISAIKDAIAGRPRSTDSEPGYTGGETPRVNGYAFVDEDEPEPEQQPDPADDPSYHLKLLTSSTTGDTGPNPFRIRENRRREELHHRMVERVARTKRAEKAAREIKTPVPRFPSSPMLNFGRTPGGLTPGGSSVSGKALTPAAQKLLQRVGSTPRPSTSSSSSNFKNMWTPTPKRK